MPEYIVIRRYGDDREDARTAWDSAHSIRVIGDACLVEDDGVKWKVTRVTAGDTAKPAAIVLEPFGE